MRTGSIGNRDAETLINTLVEPKKSALSSLRTQLLSLGYSEEAGYDAINIESHVLYSFSGDGRFLFKHKWELAVLVVLHSEEERVAVIGRFPEIENKQFEKNDEDGTIWVKIDPLAESALIVRMAESFAKS